MTDRRVWLVTGASTGLGRAIAEAARAQGDLVIATARAAEAVADFEHGAALDVTDAAQVEQVVADVVADHGRIDVVVNNAGHGLAGATEELSDADLTSLLDVNVLGVLRVTRAVLPHLRAQGSGHLVQMSSVGGVVGNPGHAAYATTKFALEGLSEALAGEVAPFGVRVTIVEPGPFRTDFAGRSMHAAAPLEAYADTDAGRRRAGFAQQDGNQPNDPVRAAEIVLAAVASPHPPLHLPLGPEAIDRVRAALAARLTDLEEWESIARDTRYAD